MNLSKQFTSAGWSSIQEDARNSGYWFPKEFFLGNVRITFCNLSAFEQCNCSCKSNNVLSKTVLMHDFINSSKDLDFLRLHNLLISIQVTLYSAGFTIDVLHIAKLINLLWWQFLQWNYFKQSCSFCFYLTFMQTLSSIFPKVSFKQLYVCLNYR